MLRHVGCRSPGWDLDVDVTVADRLASLTGSPDAVTRSRQQLDAWAAADEGHDLVLKAVRSRATASVRRASEAADPAAAASALLARNVPSAFVPALSVLLRHEPTPQKKPRPRPRKDS